MLKNNVIHGVGEAVVFDFLTGREVLRLSRMESTSWTTTIDETDVSGGDDLDIFENFETGRSQSMAFVNNEFDIRMLEAATGKRPVKTLSAPILQLSEGSIVPSTTPFTVTLKNATAQSASVRIRYSETREDLAPKPAFSNASLALNAGATTFPPATSVKVRITAVVGGIESIASAEGTITVGAAARGIDVSIPSALLSVDSSLVAYDCDVDGFNVYLAEGTGPWKKNNTTGLVAKGATYALLNTYPTPITATVGAGLTNPPVLSYEAALAVTPFILDTPTLVYNAPNYEIEFGQLGKGAIIYAEDVIGDTTDKCFYVCDSTMTLQKCNVVGATVVSVDDTDDLDALLVFKATTGMYGTIYVSTSDAAAFIAAHTELTVIRQLTAVLTKPAIAPDDFTFAPGALVSANEAGYAVACVYLNDGTNDYDDLWDGSPFSGAPLFVGNSAGMVLHTITGAATRIIIPNIDVTEDINVTIAYDSVNDWRQTILHSADIDPATVIGAGYAVVATFESVFTKPAAPLGNFTFNASALVEWPAGDILYLVPTLAGQFDVSGADITFAAPDANKGILVDYVWTTSATEYQAEVVDVLSQCLRQYVKIILRQNYKSKDGTVMGLQAVIHKAKYTGDFTLESARADAATHSMEFKIFDPERADGKIVTFTKFDSGVAQSC